MKKILELESPEVIERLKTHKPVMADILVGDVGIMVRYYNNLFKTHTECDPMDKRKITEELKRVRKWINENKQSYIK